nr:hypothetical protein [Micromonospora acroterricola]
MTQGSFIDDRRRDAHGGRSAVSAPVPGPGRTGVPRVTSRVGHP